MPSIATKDQHQAPRAVTIDGQHLRRIKRVLAPAVCTATVIAALGASLSVAPAQAVTGDIVVNGHFVTSLAGWKVSSPAVMSLTTGRSDKAARVTNSASSARTMALNDAVNTVHSTVAGRAYTATAWMRGPANTSVGLRLMEFDATGSRGQAKGSYWLKDTYWHQVSIRYTAATNGASLDLNALAYALPAGRSFDVDDVVLATELTTPTASATATTTSATSTAATTSATSTAATTSATSTAATTSATSTAATTSATSAATTTSATSTATTVPVATTTSSTSTTTSPTSTTTTTSPTSSTTTTTTTAAPPTGWTKVWGDDFDGGAVDTTRWNVRNNSWASNEYSMVTNRPTNVTVGSGVLTLRAQREQYTAYGTTKSFTSGYLDTVGKFSQLYGRFEMRAKLPTNKGLWPAFWLRSDSAKPELDVLESVGGVGTAVQTIHRSTDGGLGKAGYEVKGLDVSTWHTYAVEWDPTEVRWYVDDTMTFRKTSVELPWIATDFVTPMNIRLNLQVGGSMPVWYGKDVDASTAFPADYGIDFVRVYRR